MTPSLSAPLRVTWDLSADSRLAERLWNRLVEARVFFVEIFLTAESLSGLEGLSAGGVKPGAPKVTFMGDAAALTKAVDLAEDVLLASSEVMLLPDFGSLENLKTLASKISRITPSVWSTPDGMAHFSRAVEIARELGLKSVAALNPHQPADCLKPAHHEAAAEAWKALSSPDMDARIHDLFLSEALGKNPFKAYAGCQAGSALAYLTADGKLEACRTLPVLLGDLTISSMKEIWSGEIRSELAASLKQPPGDCCECSLAKVCLGGCRGLDPEQGRDPSCLSIRN